MTSDRKVAWVTGASRGSGADIARRLGAAGYDLAITARDEAALADVAAGVEEFGATVLVVAADLTIRASVTNFADAAYARFGRCDVVCNIGIYKGPGMEQFIQDLTPEEIARHFEADVIAPTLLCQRALEWMADHGGTILNMTSSSVWLDPPGAAGGSGWSFAYVAAKAGIDRLASIVNVEAAANGTAVRAFTIDPGFVASGPSLEDKIRRYPGMPVSPPEAIGPAVLWLLESPDASRLINKRVNLPVLTHRQGLLPDWDGPGSAYPRADPKVTTTAARMGDQPETAGRRSHD
jgi:NAD(P)-dependent dehydrogenase (short-subunit alcohol dehydrogenase family)